MTDFNTSFVQKILHISKRQRKPYVQHNGQADDFWRGLEVTKRGAFCHFQMLGQRFARLKSVSSDNTCVMPSLLAFVF